MARAILLEKTDDTVRATVQDLPEDAFPQGEVTVAVEYSTVNYKDGLAITNRSPIARTFPLVPGIDLAGTVLESASPDWAPGDRVTVNGWLLGEQHWGGLAQRCRVQAGWLTRLPEGISTRQAAAIGTAGYTAMLCVLALEEHGVTPAAGPVVVTGAAGGVGSVAVAVLARLGHHVIASTGRPAESGYLTALGAAEIIERSELSEPNPRPLQRARWAGAVDTVGSHTLANVIAQTQPNGCVAACGLAGGMDLPSSVAPFILRGVTLAGVNSVEVPSSRRDLAWARLAGDLDPSMLDAMTTEVALADALEVGADIVEGRIRGRVVVDVNR
ncbi:MAG: oxidoreductase [Acidimicrobiales bacterium]|jgi:acrylyl-CoA reductase (NADPH)|nr:oxidoreductase [Acidimicrobiales bacterium]